MASRFAQERAWDRNTPSQRVAHLVREVARIAEHSLYMEGVTLRRPAADLEKQIGDVLFSLFQLASRLGVSVEEQYLRAMEEDARKYPAAETKEKSIARLRALEGNWSAPKSPY